MDEVAVRIIGGRADEWVLVPAQMVELNMYRLLNFVPPQDRRLEFGPGDLVTTIPLPGQNETEVLVAHNLYPK